MYINKRSYQSLLPGLAIAVALAFLLLVSPVYAEGEPPPDEQAPVVEESPSAVEVGAQEPDSQEEPVVETSSIDDPGSEPVNEPAAESTATTEVNEPAAESTATIEVNEPTDPSVLPEESTLVEEPVLVDGNGELLDLASQESVELLADPDPYFTVGGVLYSFTAADCDPITDGNQPCANPIQAAFDYLSSNNLKPDSGKVYVEAGSFLGFTIDGSTWLLNKPTLIDLIGAGSSDTNITSSVYIYNLVNFYMTGFNIAGQLNFSSNTGTIKLTDVKIKNTGGAGLYIDNHSGPVSINNLTVFESSGLGAFINNTAGTGAVTIANSYFKNNTNTGLYITSRGAVTLANTHSSKNAHGAAIDNSTGSALVKVSLSTFSDNGGDGLTIISKGSVTLDNVIAAGNGSNGGYLNNSNGTGSIIVKNSQFISNGSFGLQIYSSKNVTLDGVLASNNYNNIGAYIDNTTSPTSGSPVTILRSNFSNNFLGLDVVSKSLIKLDHVTANANSDNDGARLYNSFPGATGGVTISAVYGENHFNDNLGHGLRITSNGSISLSRVFANSNDSSGVSISNFSGPGNVTIKQSRFEYNFYNGAFISTKGAVTIDQVIASYNSNNSGLSISNTTDFLSPKTIKITRSTFEFNNGGLLIDAKSNVELNNVTAAYNNGYGVYIDNCQYSGACQGKGTVNFLSSLGANYFTNNQNDNVFVHASGNILLSKVTANHSTSGAGLFLFNTNVIANITLTNVNTLFNAGNGTFADSAGSIKVTNSNFSNNTNIGGLFQTIADTTGLKTISISSSLFNNNANNDGARIVGTGNIILSNITATNNLNGYGLQINNTSGVGNVSLSGTSNQFLKNGYSGLSILSKGAVVLTNITASNNVDYGTEVNNNFSLSQQPVTVKNSAFNQNSGIGGLLVLSKGNILVDLVNASFNPGYSSGGYLDNSFDTTGLKTITIQRSIFNKNGGSGLEAFSYGTITLNSISANYNFVTGLQLDNQAGTGSIVLNNSLGENIINGNMNQGLNISTSNSVTLRSVRVSFNSVGAYINQYYALNGSATIFGSSFSNNGSDGLYLSTNRSVSLDKVNAHYNAGTGLYINSDYGPVDIQTITITRTNANNNNNTGIYVESRGLVTLNTFKTFNNGSSGLIVNNNNGGATRGVNILSQYGANWTSGNGQLGASIISAGPVSISKIIAVRNGILTNNSGLYIQTANNQNITITCALLSGNGLNGLEAELGTGTLTLNGVTAYGNDVFGGIVDPDIFNNAGSTVITNPASCGSFQ